MTETREFRYLFVTERYPPMPGGMAESAGRHVRSLRADCDLDVLCMQESAGEAIALRRQRRDGGTDYRLSHPGQSGNASQRAWAEVQKTHATRPYSAVIGFGCNLPGLVATTFAAWLDRPSVVLIRGNDFDRDWFELRRTATVQAALARATVIGAVSREKVQRVQALYPGKQVIWTPNGTASTPPSLLPDEFATVAQIRDELGADGRRVIGLFGEMKYKKRIPLLLGALRDAGLMDRVALLVVGAMDHETTTLLADPSLAPMHRHIPFRNAESLHPLYAACDFIAIPSMFEGFPNVLLEGVAQGAIPIVSSAGAMGDVVTDGETGFLFPVEDRAGAADALARAVALSADKLATMKRHTTELFRDTFSIENETAILQTCMATAIEQHAI